MVTDLIDLFSSEGIDAISLLQFPAISDLVATWQHNGRQGDPVEYIVHLTKGFQLKGIDMRWEARVQVGDICLCHDKNADPFQPIVLSLESEHCNDRDVLLSQLVLDWSNQLGMQFALIGDCPLVCLHIDRNLIAGDGSISRQDVLVNFHGGCELPFFTDTGLTVVWKEFQVVSLVTHVGTDEAGHCQSLLMVQPDTRGMPKPFLSLLTDDWTYPKRLWKAPNWISGNAVCLWLCETSHLNLFRLPPLPPFGEMSRTSLQRSAEGITMLQAMEGLL